MSLNDFTTYKCVTLLEECVSSDITPILIEFVSKLPSVSDAVSQLLPHKPVPQDTQQALIALKFEDLLSVLSLCGYALMILNANLNENEIFHSTEFNDFFVIYYKDNKMYNAILSVDGIDVSSFNLSLCLIENINITDSNQDFDVNCKCFNFGEELASLGYLEFLLNQSIESQLVECVSNNINQCVNLFLMSNNLTNQIAFCDLFYRLRHEILFKAFLYVFAIDQDHSDVPFSNFGIDSSRTPDFIKELNDEFLFIAEFTATSNYDRGLITKGSEEYGFESKYETEIQLLKLKYKKVVYKTIIFDMTVDEYNIKVDDELSAFSDFFHLNSDRQQIFKYYFMLFSKLTLKTKNKRLYPSQLLFDSNDQIHLNIQNLNFIFTETVPQRSFYYKEFIVSEFVYKRVNNLWFRLVNMLKKASSEFGKFKRVILVINAKNGKPHFEEHYKGKLFEDISDMIVNDNKFSLFLITYINTYSGLIPAFESQDGVKIYVKTKISNVDQPRLLEISTHRQIQWDKCIKDNSLYVRKSSNTIKNKMFTIYDDPNYEDKYFNEMIKIIDRKDDIYKSKSGNGLLSNQKINDIDLGSLFVNLERIYVNNNNNSPNGLSVVLHVKPTFTVPLTFYNQDDHCDYKLKNNVFVNSLLSLSNFQEKNPFTSIVLNKFSQTEYKLLDDLVQNDTIKGYDERKMLFQERYELSNRLTFLLKEFAKKERLKALPRISDVPNNEDLIDIRNSISTIDKELMKSGVTSISRSYIHINNSKKMSFYNSAFKHEMQHFRNKSLVSSFKGIGVSGNTKDNFDGLLNMFMKLKDRLLINCGEPKINMYDDYVAQDALLLYELKKSYVDNYSDVKKQIQNSQIYHSSVFVNILCKTLLFFESTEF